jgi:polyferredoxin
VGLGKNPTPEVLDDRSIKYGLLVGFLISSLVLRREVFCDFCPAGGMFRVVGPFYLGPTWQIVLPLTVLVIVLVLAVKFDHRGWCKYFCPFGAFISMVSRITPWGRVKIPAHACVECRKCEKVCPMDIDIVAETKYKLINTKAVTKVLEAEGDPKMLQMPKKFDRLPEAVQDVLNKYKGNYTIPAGECIRCFKCLDNCPVHKQILKKLKEEKELKKKEADGPPEADKEEAAK